MPDVYTLNAVEYRDGVAILTLSIPEVLFRSFHDFLKSTLHISQYAQNRARVAKAKEQANSQVEKEKRLADFNRFSSRVVSVFDALLCEDITSRQTIRQTRDTLNSAGYDIDCYSIELILRKAGRLSKPYLRSKGVVK